MCITLARPWHDSVYIQNFLLTKVANERQRVAKWDFGVSG